MYYKRGLKMQVEGNVNPNIVSINIRNNDVDVDATKIPVIQNTTKDIFIKLGVQPPEHLTYPLQDKTNILIDSIQRMKDAEEHTTRDQIFGFLRSALAVAVCVGGILGAISMSGNVLACIGIALGALISYSLIGYYNAIQAGFEKTLSISYVGPLVLLIGAAIFPIYEVCGKVSGLQVNVENQKLEIKSVFEELVFFFNNDLENLKTSLNNKIADAKKALNGLTALEVNADLGIDQIEKRKKEYEDALNEFNLAKEYFGQF